MLRNIFWKRNQVIICNSNVQDILCLTLILLLENLFSIKQWD